MLGTMAAVSEMGMKIAAKFCPAAFRLQYTDWYPEGNPRRPVTIYKPTMKLNRKPVFWGVFAALLLGATYSDALTLGRMRGAALLGQELDVTVMVQASLEDDIASTCFDADVSYGDTPLESSRVSVSVQPGTQANSQLVRITSGARIDDAVVRLTVRAKCNAKASRQYTLLSDVVSDLTATAATAPTATRLDTLTRPASSNAANVSTPGQAGLAAAPSAGSSAPAQNKTSAAASKPVVLPQARSAPKPTTAPAHAGGPDAAKAANAAALEDLQRRVDEIAKRQASSTSADEVQNSEARTKALESDMRGLQQVAAKNQQNIQLVAAAVENNAAQDIGRPLVYGLGALLLACLAALAYLALRMRAGGYAAQPWWSREGERAPAPSVAVAARAKAPVALSPLEETHSAAVAALPKDSDDLAKADAVFADTGLGIASKDSTDAPAAPPVHHPGAVERLARHDFAPSASGTLKAINTREMLDVRQQAEFFMALGQHDEAVRLLESSIRGSAECNPLVFLDLLKIFHTLSRRADFERYREEFNAQFTGRIPPYAGFLSEGNGLDAYEDICNQIVVLWPTDYTVDYIEQCLVRMPEDDPEQGIDLEAFKDLLMLYGVLKRLGQGYDSGMAPFSASRVESSQSPALNAPMTAPMPVMPTAHTGEAPPVDIDLDLDLDLDAVGDPVTPSQQNNLIDFDVSSYITPKKNDPPT